MGMAYGKQHPKPRVPVTPKSLLRRKAQGDKASKFHADEQASQELEQFLCQLHGEDFVVKGNGGFKG